MMPKKDGLAVLKELRRKTDATPVILLTARDSVEDRVAGLDAGANDYLVKPFAFEELLARVRVLLRKPGRLRKHVIQSVIWKCIWIRIKSYGAEKRSGFQERSFRFCGT